MLSILELDQLYAALGTPEAGRRLINEARKCAPVREVQSRLGNVITRFQSRKMDRPILTESRKLELPAVVFYDQKAVILEHYSQPFRLDLKLGNPDGKSTRVSHTPDFLLITLNGIFVDEWRDEKRLEKLSKKNPKALYKDPLGNWRNPQIEQHLLDMGIQYRIRTSKDLPWIFVRNVEFLADYYEDAESLSDTARQILATHFIDNPISPLADLLDIDGLTADDIYKAIVEGVIAFDMYDDLIAETSTARLYRDDATLAFHKQASNLATPTQTATGTSSIIPGATIIFDGVEYRVVHAGSKSVVLHSPAGPTEMDISFITSLFNSARLQVINVIDQPTADDIKQIGNVLTTYSSKDIDIATKRAQLLAANESECVVSERTLQRWRKQQRCAGSNGVAVMHALIPKYANCGNRTPRLPQAVLELARKYIRDNYNTPRNAHALGVYHEYSNACNNLELVPMSYPRFCKEVREMKSTRARKGKRTNYQESPITGEWNDDTGSPVHGERPLEVVHIDHTQADLETKSGRTGNLLKKPYETIARDAYTNRVIGAYLSYDPPSYRSCMMVLRDVVRRHGRLPAIVVVDNGAEFHSDDFTSLCDHYRTDIRYRPPGEPRYGLTIERIFGTINSRVLYVLEGNTQVMKQARQTTKSVNPKNHATWTLPALANAFEVALFDLMDNEPQEHLGMSIRQFFERRVAETGTRTQRLVRYDQDFMIETCPYADNRTRVIDPLRGIRIGYFFYWCDGFSNLQGKRNKVEVKIDPWDARQVFARLNGKWTVCRCTSISGIRRLTCKELSVAVDAWSETAKIRPNSRRAQDRLAEWVRIRDPANFDARLKDKTDEMRLIYDALKMTHVETDAPYDKATHSGDTPQPLNEGNNVPIDQLTDGDDYELF